MGSLTPKIVTMAAVVNGAANYYREIVDQPSAGLPAATNHIIEAANALLKAADALTAAICDEEA